jgi:autotransporter-associated beta strand protein
MYTSKLLTRLALLSIASVLWCQSTQAALIGYWPFDENTGTVVTDTSGNPNNHNGAFATGAETPAWVPGRLGSAVNFTWQAANNPAAGRRVIIPFHAELQLNGACTISYWYRPDAPFPAGTFPGIMRIGSQSALTGANVGWGFFRQNNMVYKRGNNQPGIFGNMNLGQWNHLAFRYDGNTAAGATNTIAFLNGVQVGFAAVNGWSNATATTVFELGRMDAFDQATLDDLALFNEAVAPSKIRSLYTVPTFTFLDYNIADMRALWSTFDAAAPGVTNVVKGLGWSYTTSLPGSTTLGDAYLSGGSLYVVLGAGSGVTAPLTLISGQFSPGGLGPIGSLSLAATPLTITNANLVFDLSAATTIGSGVNDLLDVTGDLKIANSTVTIDPLAALPGGTYRIINYTGIKTGSLTISNTSRYSVTLDESTAGQINLVVSGGTADEKWNSTVSGVWDLTSSNWLNTGTSLADTFFQGDSALFDESAAFQTNITLPAAVFPKTVTVTSSGRAYNFTGPGQIGGAGGGFVKNGTSVLTLSTPNTFVGDLQINAGTVKLGNATALGATNGQTIIAAGATLDLGGISPGTEAVTVQGAGVGSGGAIVNTGGGLSNNGLRDRVTLTGDTTFGGANRWDVFSGRLEGNGYKLTKSGGSEIALSNLGETGLGDIDVTAGTLTILGNTTMGDPSKTVTISPGAALAFWQVGNTFLSKTIIAQNTAILRNNTSGGTDVATNIGAVTLNGDTFFQLNAANIALLGTVSGAGSIIKQNGGVLYLGGTDTYTGLTTISGGRLALLSGASINGSTRIDVQSGTFFDVSRLGAAYPLASGQTLIGSGTVAGSLEVPTGANVSPGPVNLAATLTITNGLVISGGTLNYELAAATTEGGGVNDLINVGGNLDLSSPSSININPLGLLSVGSIYTLINYSGTLNGTLANLTVLNNSRYTFDLLNTTPGKIQIQVAGGAAANLFWFGGAFGAESLWDLRTSPNWSDTNGISDVFYGGDQASFDDFALINVVDLVGNLTPATILVNNAGVDNFGLDYVFQGTGKLSGNSTLTKIGTGKLTIANTNVNDYVGTTDIQAGTVQVGVGSTTGNLGTSAITNNGTLVYNRSDQLTFNNRMVGNGSFVKQNSNLLLLPTANSNYSGGFTINGGIVRPTITNGLGNAVGGTTIAPGATLDVNALNQGDEVVTAAGTGAGNIGAIVNNAGGQNNALRFLNLSGDITLGGTGRWDVRANPTGSLLTGGNAYNITKIAANQVSLVDLAVDPALGDINVNAGTFSVEIGTSAGDASKTVTVASGALLQFFGRTVPWNKNHVLNGGRNINNASGDTTMNGSVLLNAPVTFDNPGTSLTVNGTISGVGRLSKIGAGFVALGGDNIYTGGTTVSNGTLQLGAGLSAGSVIGPITNLGVLAVYRSDTYTLTNPIFGNGGLQIRTTNGLVLATPSVLNLGGTISAGITTPGKLIIPAGANITVNSLFLGDSSGINGDTTQLGGSVTVTNQMRVGHWPSPFVSTYIMGGGSLTLNAIPVGVVNQAGVAEQQGVIYLGIDGTGIFTQTGGVVRAHGIIMDGRGNTAGEDTFTLNGGQTIVGPSGFKSGSLDANTSYAINLGGGTLTSSANWTSVLRMTFSGTNGNTTIDTAAFTNTLTGILPGQGGLIKTGSGTLALSGAATYTGGTLISQGKLELRSPGTLGSGPGSVVVQGGTLAGTGTINDPVTIQAGGTLSPGLSIGTLTVNNTVTLGGTIVMEVSKTGSVITSDLLAASGAINYGGTLTVVASGAALAEGDVINLFDATSFTGSFGTLGLPTLASGLLWDTSKLLVDGTIRVVRQQPTMSIAYSGGSITLSWPSGFSDFVLQAQTNALNVGISSNWVTLPVTGNSVTFPVDPDAGSVFYRLLH